MKCSKCEAITPAHYKKCPACGGELEVEKRKPQEVEVEKPEEITPLAVSSDFDDYEVEI